MPSLTFTIGEVAALLGITPKTIKHYHRIGLLPAPIRDANHYRRYDMALIQRLQQILQLKAFGLSLQQIDLILHSENPDQLLSIVLSQHTNALRDAISRLQHQLEMTEDFLNKGSTLAQINPPAKPPVSALTSLSDSVKRYSTGLSDILIEIERDVMFRLDQFQWDANYEVFWHLVGKQLMQTLADESLFIFWMERYLALGGMDADDLQGAAWLNELHHSPARRMLMRVLMPSPLAELPEDEQQQILRLLASLLYQEGSALQRDFLTLLIKR